MLRLYKPLCHPNEVGDLNDIARMGDGGEFKKGDGWRRGRGRQGRWQGRGHGHSLPTRTPRLRRPVRGEVASERKRNIGVSTERVVRILPVLLLVGHI